jgi:hypothetical protein
MRRRALPAALAAALVAALLFAQALGLMHRVWHAPGLEEVPARLVDGHAHDTPECRLVDQLAHADGLVGASPAPALLPAPAAPALPSRSPALAAQAAGALARGPPAA